MKIKYCNIICHIALFSIFLLICFVKHYYLPKFWCSYLNYIIVDSRFTKGFVFIHLWMPLTIFQFCLFLGEDKSFVSSWIPFFLCLLKKIQEAQEKSKLPICIFHLDKRIRDLLFFSDTWIIFRRSKDNEENAEKASKLWRCIFHSIKLI